MTRNKKVKIKAWAVITKKGTLNKVGCHLLLQDCPFAIYDNPKPLESGKVVPCEIVLLPKK